LANSMVNKVEKPRIGAGLLHSPNVTSWSWKLERKKKVMIDESCWLTRNRGEDKKECFVLPVWANELIGRCWDWRGQYNSELLSVFPFWCQVFSSFCFW
jgi:hypothetical protein